MDLPQISGVARGADYTMEFKGINHNLYVGEHNFWDTYNLCSTDYPVMTPRAQRAKIATLENAQGLFARGKLCWAADKKLYYDGVQVQGVTLAAGQKTFVGMGAYIIVFPDGIRYNTYSGAVDNLASSFSANSATATLSRQTGEDYSNVTVSPTQPSSPSAGDYWLDTSGETPVLRMYSATGTWTAITTTYMRIEATGIGDAFRVGDVVSVSGTYKEIFSKSANWIVVPGVMDAATETLTNLSVTRDVPAMDYVCELNNRIWGCSNSAHEIYCCALGDATNWRKYGTGAGDAWTATVGSDGEFTGCCAYAGYALFFKEDQLHRVMGTKPSNFQIVDGPIRGVQKGSSKSLRVVNEVLMYKSRDGVMIYDGSSPTNVGAALGTERLYDAAAGVDGDRYYISMRTEDDKWGMWVFNEAKGLWHREDETQADDFAALDGQLYFLKHDGKLMAVRGRLAMSGANSTAILEDPIDWWCETGDMDLETIDNKYVTRIQFRAAVAREAGLTIEAQYDSSGQWVTVYRRGPSRKQNFTVPMIPARCDHVRLRISGHGRSAVYAITKQYEIGSDI